MKKTVISVSALILLLSGCSDASAKLSDSSTVLMTVGNESITKGEVYSLLNNVSGGSTVINDAMKVICDLEVEVTEDMQTSAQNTYDMYAVLYGDSFTSYLDSYGYTEETYISDVLIPSLQQDELPTKYVEQNFDALVEQYQPVQAIVLTFTTEEDKNTALSELNDGSKTAEEVASEFSLTESGTAEIFTIDDTSYDTSVTSLIRSSTADDGWQEVALEDGSAWYLVKVVETDATAIQDAVTEKLASLSDVQTDATVYFLKKYNFHVYDITVYNQIQESNPDYLVQDATEATASATTEASATAEASDSASAEATDSATAEASTSAAATESASAEASASASAEASATATAE